MNSGPSRSSTPSRTGRGPLDSRALPHLQVARPWLATVVAASTLSGLAAIAQAFALGTLVVQLLTRPTESAWLTAGIWLVGITAVRALAGGLSDYAAARAAGLVSLRLRHLVMSAALRQGWDSSSRRKAGELGLLATRGVSAVEPYITRYLPALVVAAVLPACTVLAIATQDWLSAVVVVCTIPLIPVFAILIGLATQEKSDRQWRALTTLSGHFLDVVRGLPTLVAYRRATVQGSRIRAVTDKYRQTTNETLKVAFLSSAALELIATISVALVAVTVGLRLAHGTIGFQTALVVLLMAPEAYWPLRRVGAEFHAAAEGTSTFAKIHELLETEPDSAPVELDPARPVEIRGLSLGYDEFDVLHDFSATIPARGLTAITGPSGCGKSTLMAALLGELPVRAGSISCGDQAITDSLPSWREAVAHVGQRPWIVTGSIADNVRIGRPEATDAEVEAALAKVDLRLPLASSVGEDGRLLSAGQRARLALARVVISQRPWVLLDEPTAHLDEATETVLLATLTSLARERAVVVVAHREALVDAADAQIALPARQRVQLPMAPVKPTSHAIAPESVNEPVAEVSRFRSALGTVLASLASGFGVALTATAGWLIARAAEQPPVLYLMVAIVSVRLFGLGRPALRYLERLITHDDALRLLADRRARVYDVLVPLVPAHLGRRRGDLLTSIVDDVDSLVDQRLRVRLPVSTWVILSFVAALIALINDAKAALVVLSCSLLGGALAWGLARGFAARHEPTAVNARADLSAVVVETLTHARSLVLWQRDDAVLAQIDSLSHRSAQAVSGSALGLVLGRAAALLVGGIGVVAIGLAVAPQVRDGYLTGPAGALLLLLPIALVDVMTPLADAGSLSVRTSAAQARVDALAQLPPAVTDPANGLVPPSAAVQLQRVSAAWDTEPVLTDLSLDLPVGRHIGVIGPSGCGKSTLAALLMRFLVPTSGTQTVGGINVKEISGDDVRRMVGLVDDDPYVFASTVTENIRLARPTASDDDVARALEAAHLGTWLGGLPRGLATHLGEGNVQVSGGERARIGLARAILADPPVLVLDEPTAHLDTDTAEALTSDLLAASDARSLVWITHTSVGLDQMDEVIELGR